MPALVVGIVLDGCGEERVDEGRLAKSRLASNLDKTVTVSTAVTRNTFEPLDQTVHAP
jgi:hypothetical protein